MKVFKNKKWDIFINIFFGLFLFFMFSMLLFLDSFAEKSRLEVAWQVFYIGLIFYCFVIVASAISYLKKRDNEDRKESNIKKGIFQPSDKIGWDLEFLRINSSLITRFIIALIFIAIMIVFFKILLDIPIYLMICILVIIAILILLASSKRRREIGKIRKQEFYFLNITPLGIIEIILFLIGLIIGSIGIYYCFFDFSYYIEIEGMIWISIIVILVIAGILEGISTIN